MTILENIKNNLFNIIIPKDDVDKLRDVTNRAFKNPNIDNIKLCDDVIKHLPNEAAKQDSKEIFKYLLSKDINTNSKNDNGDNLIFVATQHGSINVLKLLKEYGANFLDMDSKGRGLVEIAAEKVNLDLIQLFDSYNLVKNRLNSNKYISDIVCINANNTNKDDAIKILDNIIKDKNELNLPENKTLATAVLRSPIEIVQWLVDNKADINKDSNLLYYAGDSHRIEIFDYLLDNNINIVNDFMGLSPFDHLLYKYNKYNITLPDILNTLNKFYRKNTAGRLIIDLKPGYRCIYSIQLKINTFVFFIENKIPFILNANTINTFDILEFINNFNNLNKILNLYYELDMKAFLNDIKTRIDKDTDPYKYNHPNTDFKNLNPYYNNKKYDSDLINVLEYVFQWYENSDKLKKVYFNIPYKLYFLIFTDIVLQAKLFFNL